MSARHTPTNLNPVDCAVLVVGGGINGVGIARDLAGRGLSVILAEKDDLASHTSSSSTKLIHGGLRYLEHREFSLVRKALQEREVLLRSAPHIMRPLRFVLPHDAHLRPAWMIRLGLFLYDHLATREFLPGSRGLTLQGHPLGAPLKAAYTRGFVYSDGWVDDARLVVLNAQCAQAHGAEVLTRTRVVSAVRETDGQGEPGWRVVLQQAPELGGGTRTVRCRALVNAAGPWAAQFLADCAGVRSAHSLRLVKGSHIVVPRMFDHQHAYIFQAPDGRIVFAIPYEQRYTLIGTTDVEIPSMPDQARIAEDEVRYLCEQASRYFKQPVLPGQVCWSYAGVRPLLEDANASASAVTRDYLLETDDASGAPVMTVWGGKITTYRKLAEQAADQLCQRLGHTARAWTAQATLPGGDVAAQLAQHTGRRPTGPDQGMQAWVARLQVQWPWLTAPVLQRWAHTYGTAIDQIVGQARSLSELGPTEVPGLYQAELRHLVRHEWARHGDDVLWRRTKLGLHLTPSQQARVAELVEDLLVSEGLSDGRSEGFVQRQQLLGELVPGVEVHHRPRQLV
jgi:glycerol-3-phosphate dehydrogenase